MDRAVKKIVLLVCFMNLMSFMLRAQEILSDEKDNNKYITTPYVVPYERPIGFSFNALGVVAMTYEARFFLGLGRGISLVVSPMYQKTIELPFYSYKTKETSFFDIQRANLGLGIRGQFYKYDSRNNWYIEALARGGMAWVGQDKMVGSVIPSVMFGYETVYESGYSVSFGVGIEWEFLLGKKGADATYLKESYFSITKFPLIAELSVGWLW